MSRRLALCLFLVCASFPLLAVEVRMAGANGDGGGCPSATRHEDDSIARDTPAKAGALPIKRTTKAHAGSAHAGSGDGDVRPLRWHSFLPGMFR